MLDVSWPRDSRHIPPIFASLPDRSVCRINEIREEMERKVERERWSIELYSFVSRPASTAWVSSKFSYLPFFLLPLVCDSRLRFHRRSNNSIRRILTAGTGPALLLAIMRSENHRKLLKSQETLYVLNGQKVWLPLDLRCRNFAFAITATRHGSSSLFPPFYLSSSEFSSSTWNRKLSRPPPPPSPLPSPSPLAAP